MSTSGLFHACIALACLVTCSAACTEASESIGNEQPETRIRPNGDDRNAGTLVLLPPPGGGAPVVPATAKLSSLPTGEKPVGDGFSGLPAGQARFSVTSSSNQTTARHDGVASIEVASTTEVPLAGVRLKRAGMPITFGVSFGETPRNITSEFVSTRREAVSASISLAPQADGVEVLPAGPGRYTFRWGAGDGILIETTQGNVTANDLWDYRQRRVARVIAPAARELPEACATGANPRAGNIVIRGSGGPIGEQARELAVGASFEVGQNPSLLGRVAQKLVLLLPCVIGEVPVPLGALGAGPASFALGRLDVDDVDLRQPDGTTRKVRGRYSVFNPSTNQPAISISPATNTGIDLPPGEYKIVVSYETTAGTTETFEQRFTTP